jgi:translation initiation factor 5B
MYLSELEATVLEVKVVEGFGTTIDVVLSNGVLREGDRVVLCGQNGPIATNVRALLTPQPLRELRIKSAYQHHKEVKAALGVKIAANDLDKAVAGSRLLLVGPDDDEEELMDDVMDDLTGLLDSVDKSGRGVCVQASTLGSLEALLDFLKDMKIPVMSIALGPVYKKDVMRATTMLEKDKSLAIMLCFDVKIDKDAERYADEQGVKLFSADIIYHLFDDFVKHQKKLQEQKRLDTIDKAVFPCVLHTVQIINKRSPMIIGVDVVEGSLRIGTPICAVKTNPETGAREVLELGKVTSMEVNHKSESVVRKGQTNAGVAMRIDTSSGQPTWGRHIDEKDVLYSSITRKSIDTLKDPVFRNDVPREDWLLLRNLKTTFGIK